MRGFLAALLLGVLVGGLAVWCWAASAVSEKTDWACLNRGLLWASASLGRPAALEQHSAPVALTPAAGAHTPAAASLAWPVLRLAVRTWARA